jgi:DNA-binding NarL/FixJ family response regulator
MNQIINETIIQEFSLKTNIALIVDDNLADLEYMQLILERHHILTECIDKPQDALRIFNPQKHDIVLLDIQMPEMDGYDLSLKIKEKTEAAGIPIIFISALDPKKNIQKAFSVGAQDYIQKPIVPNEIIARVKARLKQSKHLKQLKNNQPVSRHFDSGIQAEDASDELDTGTLSILDENLSRLNLLKNEKLPYDQRKKIIQSIENNIKDNTSVFFQKSKKYKLTPTQQQVVLLLMSGLSSKEIAEALYVSIHTIKTHRKHIRKKLGVTNQRTNIVEFFS